MFALGAVVDRRFLRGGLCWDVFVKSDALPDMNAVLVIQRTTSIDADFEIDVTQNRWLANVSSIKLTVTAKLSEWVHSLCMAEFTSSNMFPHV